MTKNRYRLIKALKILAKIGLGILLFLIILILFIRSPWGQDIIKDKVISSVAKKTGAHIELEKFFVEFDGSLHLEDLYIEDEEGDTLIYSKELSANISLLPLIKSEGFYLNDLDWKHVRANIVRKDTVSGFNFEFITNAYTSKSNDSIAVDSTSSSMVIKLGDLQVKKFDVKYIDKVSGIISHTKFDKLDLEFQDFSLDKMIFNLGEASLAEARIEYEQNLPFPESSSEPPPAPTFNIENLKVNNVQGSYNSAPDSLDADWNISELVVLETAIDLKDQLITSKLLSLSESSIKLQIQDKISGSSTMNSTSDFKWPEWKIDIAQVDLENDHLFYSLNDTKVEEGIFNANAIELDSLYFNAKDILYEPGLVKSDIANLSFKEGSGIDFNQFNTEFVLNEKSIQIKNLDLDANSNRISGVAQIDYQDFQSFISNPQNARINLEIDNLRLDPVEIFRFQPQLKNDPIFKLLTDNLLEGKLKATGNLKELKLYNSNVSWGSSKLKANGVLFNLNEPEQLAYNFPDLKFNTSRKDILKFLNEEQYGIQIPENILLQGRFKGDLNGISTNATLNTSLGTVKIQGELYTADSIQFDIAIQTDSLAIGRILKNNSLGNLGFVVKAEGSGNTINQLDIDLDSEITSLTFNDYEFRKIELNGEIENGKGPVNLIYKDPNLDMNLNTIVQLDSINPRIDIDLSMDGANLGELGLTRRNIKTGFDLKGWFKGNSESYEAYAEMSDGVVVFNNESYLLGNVETKAYVRSDSTSLRLDNRIVNMDLQSNASPGMISKAVNNHFRRYISQDFQEDTVSKAVNIKLDIKVSESPVLTEVFLLNLEKMDTITFNMDFKESERIMNATLEVPHITYYNSEIDSLGFVMNSDATDLKFRFAFNALEAGPLAIKKTMLQGRLLEEKLNLDFSSIYKDKPIVHLSSDINFQGDTLQMHINPEKLILNGNNWEVSPENQFSSSTNYISFKDFRLFRNDQVMQIKSSKANANDQLSLNFKNFKLSSFLNYLNPEEKLASGEINGELIYKEPFGKTGLLADLQIEQFKILDVNLNTLSLTGNSEGFNSYNFEMFIKGGAVDLDLTGNYAASEDSADLDMNLDLNEVKMAAVQAFSQGSIKNSSGSFSGNIKLNGTVAEPKYNGVLQFNQAQFNISAINTAFILANEKLGLNENSISFNDFKIGDTNSNSIIVNGDIKTENILNPAFDLKVNAKDFQLLNSTSEDNELFYGKAVVDADAKVNGDLNLPKIDLNLKVKESTNFTYVIPETELQIKEREGVVIFVNKENPDDILTQNEEESYVVSGYDIRSRITVSQGAKFSMIINQETEDEFQVQGEGDLLFNMFPNGRMALTGIYEINDGFYEMSLYNLVKRRFEIADGSRVSWAGDPFEAQLDVRAIYDVETSASSLMAAQLSGADPSITGRYRQELPFLVYLNIDGELMEPKITFNIDMPEDEQGALGGQVYGRIQQLNNQEEELNKQVFSLLVLNRFYPESGSDGSSGGTLAVARDNLNDALSDQLNMLSNRLLGESGLQLNFELDSYTDYQGTSPENRTQLDISAQKAFMDNRLIVEVGSEVDIEGGNQQGQESSPMIGNLSIAYLLDEEGIWRLKGFRRNQYENVIDGQLIVSGIALIFTKEFNKFKNLFETAIKKEMNKESKEEPEAVNDKAVRDEN